MQAGADELRTRLNGAWAACQAAWARGEERLKQDASWQKLTPDQRRAIRESCGLLEVPEPKVAKPEDIVEELQARSLAAWGDLAKALPTRVEDALAEAAALLEPKVRTLALPGGILRTEPELDAWLADLRARIAKALTDGPVIPKV